MTPPTMGGDMGDGNWENDNPHSECDKRIESLKRDLKLEREGRIAIAKDHDRLEGKVKRLQTRWEKATYAHDVERIQQEVERLRVALEWYGQLYRTTEELLNDNGKIANEALAAADPQDGKQLPVYGGNPAHAYRPAAADWEDDRGTVGPDPSDRTAGDCDDDD